MFNNDVRDLLRKYDQQDMLASVLRTTLAVAVPFGGVINEFVTHLIPAQRVSRLAEFVEELNERLSGLEDAFKRRVETSPGFAVLTEETILAAVRTASSERRRDLAELLRTGLSRPDAELLEHEKLLHLLERLNDAQVLILRYYGFDGPMNDPARDAYFERHAAVLDVRPSTFGDSEEQGRRWTMRRLFEDEMATLGLLGDRDGAKGMRVSGLRHLEITPLGTLLLQAIGCPCQSE